MNRKANNNAANDAALDAIQQRFEVESASKVLRALRIVRSDGTEEHIKGLIIWNAESITEAIRRLLKPCETIIYKGNDHEN